jgi:hypothetical protein
MQAHLQAFREAHAAYRQWHHVWNALFYGPLHTWSIGRKYRGKTQG